MTGILLTALIAVALSVLGRETWGWLPRLSRAMIWLHTLPLPTHRRTLRREEWKAELASEYEDRRVTGFLWTLSLCTVSAWERLTTPLAGRPPAAGSDADDARALVEAAAASAAELLPTDTKLFVGSLSWSTTDDSLSAAFAGVADVESLTVVADRETGRSRGFAHVDVASAEDALAGVALLNDYELDGRRITVNLRRDRQDR